MADNNGTPLPAGAPYNRGEQLKMWLGGEAELPPGAPYNRDEQLTMWLGDDAELPPGAPYNRDEQLTMWLKDHIGGGGNPNYVETITGTIANPWGSYSPATLLGQMINGNLTFAITAIVEEVSITFTPVSVNNNTFVCLCGNFEARSVAGGVSLITADSECLFYKPFTGVLAGYGTLAAPNDYDEYADSLTTLTIIHHPLPDTTP